MESNDSVSEFMGGLFFAAFVTAIIIIALGYAGIYVPGLAWLHSFEQMLVSVVLAIIILMTRPVLFKTIWSEQRDPYLLDQDVTADSRVK